MSMPDRQLQVHARGDGIAVTDGPVLLLSARWLQNRLHWHDRIFRLVFTLAAQLGASDAVAAVRLLVRELQYVLIDGRQPLLFRATVASDSVLLPALRSAGFLVARHVFEPILNPREVMPDALPLPAGADIMSLAEARKLLGDAVLTQLYLEVYARSSRLDPATPEHLPEQELESFLFGDEQLAVDLSCCVVFNGVPVGLVPVFHGETPQRYELGAFGVANSQLERHEQLTGRMLTWVFEKSVRSPWLAEQFTAEIDSDDPYVLYACAAFPFRSAAESVSLFFVPHWTA